MKTQDFIHQLGLSLNLPDLALDDNNVCRLVCDGHPIDFEKLPDSEDLFIIAEVCPLPPTGRETLFRRLLEGNRYGIETADATLSLDPDQNAIILHRKLDMTHLDYAAFTDLVSLFYARLLHWKDLVQKAEPAGKASFETASLAGMIRA